MLDIDPSALGFRIYGIVASFVSFIGTWTVIIIILYRNRVNTRRHKDSNNNNNNTVIYTPPAAGTITSTTLSPTPRPMSLPLVQQQQQRGRRLSSASYGTTTTTTPARKAVPQYQQLGVAAAAAAANNSDSNNNNNNSNNREHHHHHHHNAFPTATTATSTNSSSGDGTASAAAAAHADRKGNSFIQHCVIFLLVSDSFLALFFLIECSLFLAERSTVPFFSSAAYNGIFVSVQALRASSFMSSGFWTFFISVAIYLSLKRMFFDYTEKSNDEYDEYDDYSNDDDDTRADAVSIIIQKQNKKMTRPAHSLLHLAEEDGGGPIDIDDDEPPSPLSTTPRVLVIHHHASKPPSPFRRYRIAFHLTSWLVPILYQIGYAVLMSVTYNNNNTPASIIALTFYLFTDALTMVLLELCSVAVRIMIYRKIKRLFDEISLKPLRALSTTAVELHAQREQRQRQVLFKMANYTAPFLLCNIPRILQSLVSGILFVYQYVKYGGESFSKFTLAYSNDLLYVLFYANIVMFPLQGLLNVAVYIFNSKMLVGLKSCLMTRISNINNNKNNKQYKMFT